MQRSATQRAPAPVPASGWWNGALRGNLTYDILKASRPLVGVCWNVGMSDGFCVGHGILHLARYGPYDGRDRWLRVWKPPCEVRAIRDIRAGPRTCACVRAGRVYVHRRVHTGTTCAPAEEDSRVFRLIPRDKIAAALRGRMMEMNFLWRGMLGASIIWQLGLTARVNATVVRTTDAHEYALHYFAEISHKFYLMSLSNVASVEKYPDRKLL